MADMATNGKHEEEDVSFPLLYSRLNVDENLSIFHIWKLLFFETDFCKYLLIKKWEYEDEDGDDYEWEYSEEEEEEEEDEDDKKDDIPLDEQDLPDPFSTSPLEATTKVITGKPHQRYKRLSTHIHLLVICVFLSEQF